MIGEHHRTGNVAARLFMAVLLLLAVQVAAAARLEPLRDLRVDARHAACRGQPLVLLFSTEGCSFCRIVRELYLQPILRDGQYPGIVIREVDTSSKDRVTDFNGEVVSMQDLAYRYDTWLVPVVVLVDPDGDILANPMVGISSQDYYGYYLDEAIVAAGKKVRQKLSGAPSGAPQGYACD
jgi:thioredoxin-related protein